MRECCVLALFPCEPLVEWVDRCCPLACEALELEGLAGPSGSTASTTSSAETADAFAMPSAASRPGLSRMVMTSHHARMVASRARCPAA